MVAAPWLWRDLGLGPMAFLLQVFFLHLENGQKVTDRDGWLGKRIKGKKEKRPDLGQSRLWCMGGELRKELG